MHIGVDVDNTILDATSAHLHYYNKASGLSFTPDDVDDFYLYRLYGWDKAEREAVYHRYGHDIHWNSSPFPMAVEILRQLFHEHQLSIITARPLLFRDVTMEWLKRHQIHYHNLTFTENKLQVCMDAKIDVLIDDGPHYAEEFALVKKPVILYEQPYNLSVTNDFVYRASNWNEVKKHIDDLESKRSLI
ncbi:5' nucleotidase, NT5C type [Paenibacillus sp. MBLB4367]|uniref:5' nucleotidase, NT5C type n=1 Tax=Paenibacillus sp. MBLB4367 TaxID=3384767 RepID=UPI003908244E